MKRKWLSLLLAVVLVVGCLPLSAGAASSGTCGKNVTWTLSSDGTLTISGTGAIYDYGEYTGNPLVPPWYNYREKIKAVNISEGITEIGDRAFLDCTALPGITFPASLTRIGSLAFDGCSGLKRITIPSGVTSMGVGKFSHCSGLTEILVAENNAEYTSEDGILFNKGKTALYEYPGGKKGPYEIPANVTSISRMAFCGCFGLTSVTFLNDKVEEIHGETFMDCTNLTSATLPAKLTMMGTSEFEGCSSLKSITIPSGVTKLLQNTFHGCTSLTNVTLPAGLTDIDDGVFGNCSSLKSINLPAGLTSIMPGVFDGCSSLTSITIPAGLDSIPGFMFRDCTSLTSVTLPADLTYIGTQAFMGCTSLKSIDIPSGVRDIGNAFTGCSSLTNIIIPEGATSIDFLAFQGCSSLKNIVIPSSVTNIEGGAFQLCSSLTSVVIPENVTSIDCQAFASCSSLKKAVFRGNAPAEFNDPPDLRIFGFTHKDFCIYYPDGASGWTTPTWKGYPCKPISQMPPDPDIPLVPGNTQFTDVPANAYYEDAVKWAVENEITSGTSATRFSPNSSCTRAQAVTFLWRAAGSPKPQSTTSAFTDVAPNSYYEEAVQWAVENGVTSGTSATKFSPNAKCTRSQIVTLQWRAAQKPEVNDSGKFTDVPDDAFYKDAVNWAVENGITTGVTDATFAPTHVCDRAQIVTFLYRDAVGN